MGELVIYHNDFNRINLPQFTELEQNLLFAILAKIKDKKVGESILIYPQDLKNFSEKNLTNKELVNIVLSLREKFFKADFTRIIEDKEKGLIGYQTLNLFSEFIIYIKNLAGKSTTETFALRSSNKKSLESAEFSHISFGVNPQFEYILNDLTKNFTRFEFIELASLKGRYTKTLYRLLKQYRTTGWMQIDLDEFCYIMDIPETYTLRDIDMRVLNPAIIELTRERTLFDHVSNKKASKIPFKNISVKKIRGKGKGGKIVALRFDFDKQFTPKQIEAQQAFKEIQIKESQINKDFLINDAKQEQCYLHRTFEVYDSKYNKINYRKIVSLQFDGISKKYIVRVKDMENNKNVKGKPFVFNDLKHLDNFLKKYEYFE